MLNKQAGREYAASIMRFESDSAGEIIDFFKLIVRSRQSPRLNSFLLHPSIPVAEKVDLLLSLAVKPVPALIDEILADLVGRRSLQLLPVIIEELDRIREEREGIREVEVRGAIELTKEQKKRIESAIGHATGKKPKIVFSTDTDLIAGFRIKIGDTVLDNTVSRQLETIGDLLNKASAA